MLVLSTKQYLQKSFMEGRVVVVVVRPFECMQDLSFLVMPR